MCYQEEYEHKTDQVASIYFLGWLRPDTKQNVKGGIYWKSCLKIIWKKREGCLLAWIKAIHRQMAALHHKDAGGTVGPLGPCCQLQTSPGEIEHRIRY